MNEKLLELLFKIPDPITADEFSRRTGSNWFHEYHKCLKEKQVKNNG